MEGVKKRNREELEVELPELKRMRYDILFDTSDDVGVDLEVSELTSVMKSFEEEIEFAAEGEKLSLSSSSSSTAAVAAEVVVEEELDLDLSMLEIGWLLEASDDELGLPPSGDRKQLLPSPCLEPAAEDGWGVEVWDEDLFGYENAAFHSQGFS